MSGNWVNDCSAEMVLLMDWKMNRSAPGIEFDYRPIL
jgi:hypothetical protein